MIIVIIEKAIMNLLATVVHIVSEVFLTTEKFIASNDLL